MLHDDTWKPVLHGKHDFYVDFAPVDDKPFFCGNLCTLRQTEHGYALYMSSIQIAVFCTDDVTPSDSPRSSIWFKEFAEPGEEEHENNIFCIAGYFEKTPNMAAIGLFEAMPPGSTRFDFFGLSDHCWKRHEWRNKATVIREVCLWVSDYVSDGNTIHQYLATHNPGFAAITGLGVFVSTYSFFYRAHHFGKMQGNSAFGQIRHVLESCWNRGMMIGTWYDLVRAGGVEDSATLTVIPYSLIICNFEWTWATASMFLSPLLAAKALGSASHDQHFKHTSRMTYISKFAEGEMLRQFVGFVGHLGIFPLCAVGASAIFNAHKHFLLWRWVLLCVYGAYCLVTPVLFGMLKNQVLSGVFWNLSAYERHRIGAVHFKTSEWAPYWILTSCLFDRPVRVFLLLAPVWCFCPGAPDHFNQLFSLRTTPEEVVPPVRTVVSYVALVANVSAYLLRLAMVVLAQCTTMYPAASFSAKVWPPKDQQ